MWDTFGYGFSAILVVNEVSIVDILVINRVWFLEDTTSSFLLTRPSMTGLHNTFNIGLNYIVLSDNNYKAGLKQGID